MAKYKRKNSRRWRFVETKDGYIIEDNGLPYEKLLPDNVKRVFLARPSPIRRPGQLVWTGENGTKWYLDDAEDLVNVDGNYVRQSKARTIARTVTTSSGTTELIGGANAGFFDMDLPDIQGFIQKLDLLDENINKAVRSALHKGADIILAEQRRLAPHNLSHYISKGQIYTTKKGTLGIAIGYMSDTFHEDENGFNAGVVGMTYEFGRPGNGVFEPFGIDRSSPTMIQVRNGQEVEVHKGTIQPHPHIRRGFHNAAPQACQAVIDAIQNEIDKMGDN